jgi:hypothetical protein
MDANESLLSEIRGMALECAVCEQDARDAELAIRADLALEGVAHPEDAFAYDLIPHRRGRHRDRLLKKIELWASMRQHCC